MRFPGFFIAIFFSVTAQAGEALPICVQTFNAYGPAYSSNKTARAEGLAASLLAEPCDVVQLQEVWRISHYQLLETKLRSGNYNGIYPDSIRGDRALSGLSTFSKYAPAEMESRLYTVNNVGGFLDWIRGIGKVEKGISWMRIPALENLWVLNTHTHPSVVEVRIAQMLELVRFTLDKVPLDAPVVLTADLNAQPESIELRLLRNVLLFSDTYTATNGSYTDKICTYCSDNPLSWDNKSRVIDFVLVRNQGPYELAPQKSKINLKVWQGTTLSDHYGVRTDFLLHKRAPEYFGPDSPELKTRISEAQKTLIEARSALEKDGRRMFRPHIEYVNQLINDLNRLDIGSRLGKFYSQK